MQFEEQFKNNLATLTKKINDELRTFAKENKKPILGIHIENQFTTYEFWSVTEAGAIENTSIRIETSAIYE